MKQFGNEMFRDNNNFIKKGHCRIAELINCHIKKVIAELINCHIKKFHIK